MALKLRTNCSGNCEICGGVGFMNDDYEQTQQRGLLRQRMIHNCGSYCVYCGEVLVRTDNGIDIHDCEVLKKDVKCVSCNGRLFIEEERKNGEHFKCSSQFFEEMSKCRKCQGELKLCMEQMYGYHQGCLECVGCGNTKDQSGNFPCFSTSTGSHYHDVCRKCTICGTKGQGNGGDWVCPLTMVHHSCI